MTTLKVTIDANEPEDIRKKALEHFPDAVIESLLCADFACGHIGVERKELSDFVGSVVGTKDKKGNRKPGRVFRQADDMAKNFKQSWVIIIGDPNDLDKLYGVKGFTAKQFWAAVASIEAKRGVHVKVFKTHARMWSYMKIIFEKGNEDCTEQPDYSNMLHANNSSDDVYLQMLSQICCVAGVGYNKGELILSKFTPYELYDATIKDLCSIKGIGKVQAAKIKKCFTKVRPDNV